MGVVTSLHGVDWVSWACVCPCSLSSSGKPSHLGQSRCIRVCGSFSRGVSALRYPSGQADPLDIGGQMSTSSATGIVVAEIHAERDQSPSGCYTTSRQPSATAAAARLPPEGPSLAPNYGDRPTRRVQSLSARSSSSFRSLSPPVLFPSVRRGPARAWFSSIGAGCFAAACFVAAC